MMEASENNPVGYFFALAVYNLKCNFYSRQNIQKLLGFAPSRAASKQGGALFAAPPAQFK